MTASAPPLRAPDRPTIIRHFVLAALLGITLINYVQRNALNAPSTTVGAEFGLDDAGMGLILGAFFLSYTFMQLPAGAFAQWIGAKWALVLIATLWSIATAACALAQGFYDLYWGRIVLGVFQAGIFSCATLILAAWYPKTSRGFATALLNSFMLVGGVVSSFLAGRLLESLGWRWLLVVYAVPGILWAVWFAWWFRSRPADHPGVNGAERRLIAGPLVPPFVSVPAPRSIRRVVPLFAILAVTLLCSQQACRAGANRLVDTLMPTYYEKDRGTSKKLAADLSGWLQIAGVVGGLVGGLLSDVVLRRTGSLRLARNGVALFSLFGSVVLYLVAYPIADIYASSAVFGLGLLLFSFSSPCAYALAIDMGGKNLAIVFSLMNMAGNLGAWAFVSFLPSLAQSHGWEAALMVFVAMHLVAAACWMGLDPNAELTTASNEVV